MIGAGGMLWLLDQGIDIPGQIGIAGFNNVELLQGLPRKLATMDACRAEIGETAARIILERSTLPEGAVPGEPQQVTLAPKITWGDTLRRRTGG
jgi:LacI family gluconate utilization system Gnt-I transcriptional repressor